MDTKQPSTPHCYIAYLTAGGVTLLQSPQRGKDVLCGHDDEDVGILRQDVQSLQPNCLNLKNWKHTSHHIHYSETCSCFKRPPLFKNHLVMSQLWLYNAFLPLLRDHLYSKTMWSLNTGLTVLGLMLQVFLAGGGGGDRTIFTSSLCPMAMRRARRPPCNTTWAASSSPTVTSDARILWEGQKSYVKGKQNGNWM